MIRRIEPHAAGPLFSGTFVLADEGAILGSVEGINLVGDNVEAVVSGSYGHVEVTGDAAVTGSVGDWSIYYAFHTGTPVSPGQIAFSGLTGSMVTGILCDEWDVDGARALMRLDRMRMNGLYISVWSTANPLKWWMGQIERDTGGDQVGDIVLSVGYQGHSGGDTPFDEGERVVLTAGFRELAIYDDGVFQVNASALDFGANLDVSTSGSHVTIDGQAGGGGNPPTTGSIVVFDEGVILGSVLGMNFTGDNVEAVVSGSYAHIMHTGTAGGGGGALTVSTGSFDVGVVLLDETLIQAQATFYVTGSFSDYEYVEIHLTGRKSTSGTASVLLALNEDTTDANYRRTLHQAEVGSHTVTEADDRLIGYLPGLDGPANVANGIKATIFNPGDSTYFTTIASAIVHTNPIADVYVMDLGLLWEDTSAITEIGVALNADNFVAGSRCKIVGFRERVVVTDVSGGDFLDLADTPASYSGQSGSFVKVNSTEDALEFASLPDIGARVYNNANISINNATFTALTFNTERWDTDGIHSTVANTQRLTAQTAGKYVITGHIEFASDGVGTRIVGIRLNGSTYLAQDRNDAITGDQRMSLSTVWNFAVGDYVELVVYQSSGGNLNVKVNANFSPEFVMQKIG